VINDVATTILVSREVEKKQKIQDEKNTLRNTGSSNVLECGTLKTHPWCVEEV